MNARFEPTNWDFEKLGHRGKAFQTDNLVSSSAFLIIEIDGEMTTSLRQRECDFVYYVLAGSGVFLINGNEQPCAIGNLIVVPAGSTFSYRGELRMLLVSSPPWWPEQEETVTAG